MGEKERVPVVPGRDKLFGRITQGIQEAQQQREEGRVSPNDILALKEKGLEPVRSVREDLLLSEKSDEIRVEFHEDGTVRVYGHDPSSDMLCILCEHVNSCDKDVLKKCFVPCGVWIIGMFFLDCFVSMINIVL